ncbi:MAG TPA: hypothetical protein V6D14_23060 [Coleofasciculaceae cyanobacterium]
MFSLQIFFLTASSFLSERPNPPSLNAIAAFPPVADGKKRGVVCEGSFTTI